MEVDILFSGSGPHLEFVEVEDSDGNSVKIGEWVTVPRRTPEGIWITYQALRVTVSDE